jgi:ubiquinone/menaquinone biosynthesis C-methylase UbiE
MKLSFVERSIVNNPVRTLIQKHLEGPMLRKMRSRDAYPVCLEIGCGRGIGAQVIVEQFGAENVIATDIDPEQIKRAKRMLRPEFEGRIEFKVEDAMALDEPDGKFDAVFSFGVIHHMEDWKKAVKEVSRVLKSGGEFFFEEPLRAVLRNPLTRIFAPHPQGGEFRFEEFENELKLNVMEIVQIKRIDDLAIFGVERKR